ncbi:MAG TPA: LacI family DNA-binding transcriptional regulator, partial [Geminicoccaceae bacterium]
MAGEAPPPGGWRMEDVARRAGVSQMTVSRALRTPEKVASATRARIAAAVAELDYVPDLVAGGLAARRSGLVAVIVSTLENSIFAATVQGLSAALHGQGYAVLLGASDYSREGEEELLRAVLGRRPDGIVLTDHVHSPAARRLLTAAGVPVVETWELPAAPIDVAVGFSNHAAGRAMVLALHGYGYRRIAFVGSAAEDDRRGRLRREGYSAALAELGAGPPREVGLPAAVIGITDGPAALGALLAAYPDADAAFCVVDALAAALLLA